MTTIIAALCLVGVFPSLASPERIVLVSLRAGFTDESWPEAEERTRLELEAMGFEVVTVQGAEIETDRRRHELEQAAKKHDAVAALRMGRLVHNADVDIWVADRLTNKVSNRVLKTGGRFNKKMASMVALRAVELLNASFMELRTLRLEREIQIPPLVDKIVNKAAPPPPAPSRTRDISLDAGIGLVEPAGAVGALVGPTLTGRYHLTPALALELAGFATPVPVTLSEGDESAQIGVATLDGTIAWRPWQDTVVSPAIAGGAGVLVLWATGNASSPYRAKKDLTATALLEATPSVSLRLSPWMHLRLVGSVAWVLPKIRILFYNRNRARFGPWLLKGGIELETPWL